MRNLIDKNRDMVFLALFVFSIANYLLLFFPDTLKGAPVGLLVCETTVFGVALIQLPVLGYTFGSVLLLLLACVRRRKAYSLPHPVHLLYNPI